MRYSGIQPQYFPRLHYFARILAADIFVIRDDAQFLRKHKYPSGKVDKSYQAHTPIKQAFGTQLLMVPTKHEGFIPLHKTKITYDHKWMENHLKTLQIAYAKSLNFKQLYPEVKELLTTRHQSLVDLNIATILWGIVHLLGMTRVEKGSLSLESVEKSLKSKKTFRLSQIKKATESKAAGNFDKISPNEKIVSLIKEFGANEDYCGGTGAAAYMDESIFASNGIKITVQDWKCQEYPQLFTKQQGFIPNLSIIDLLMNVPTQKAVETLVSSKSQSS
ncbi:MAG: WbqC family protein [Candidatus Woykebacteria bacterium]